MDLLVKYAEHALKDHAIQFPGVKNMRVVYVHTGRDTPESPITVRIAVEGDVAYGNGRYHEDIDLGTAEGIIAAVIHKGMLGGDF